MKSFRKIIWLVLAIIATVIAVWLWVRPGGPFYEGVALVDWFAQADPENHESTGIYRAQHAVAGLGVRALPFLMEQFRSSDSPLSELAVHVRARLARRRFVRASERRRLAFNCLMDLGPQAGTAVPELVRLSQDPNAPNQRLAIVLLGAIHQHDEITAPVLEELARSAEPPVRTLAVQALEQVRKATK